MRAVRAAGSRPSRRSGHVAVYDPAGERMLIAHGFDSAGRFSADTWALRVPARRWVCVAGAGAGCLRPAPAPPGRAFAAAATAGQQLFVLGGAGLDQAMSCRAGRRVSGLLEDLWALSLATAEWTPVAAAPAGAAAPPGRQAGLRAPLVLVGGAVLNPAAASSDNSRKDASGAVMVLGDVWVLDAAPSEAGAAPGDRAAEFGGAALVRVALPAWCAGAGSLGTLWLELWARPEAAPAAGGAAILLAEARLGGRAVLRWTLVGVPGRTEAEPATYLSLTLTTAKVCPAPATQFHSTQFPEPAARPLWGFKSHTLFWPLDEMVCECHTRSRLPRPCCMCIDSPPGTLLSAAESGGMHTMLLLVQAMPTLCG